MKFYIADTHFSDEIVLRFSKKEDLRQFDNVKHHDKFIIENWNKAVNKNDEVYILGDFSKRSATDTAALLNKLNGKKYLIKGNHDKWYSRQCLENCFEKICDVITIADKDKTVTLSHYPMLFYRFQHKDGIHLYGHIHNTTEEKIYIKMLKDLRKMNIPCRAYNVGAMMNYMDFTPKPLEYIIEKGEEHIMKNSERIKYFLMDLDNTFLREDKSIPEENIRALNELKKIGVNVVLCSGRSNMSLDVYAKKLCLDYAHNYIIAYNGCRIYEADTKKVLYEKLLDKNIAVSISNIVTKLIENTLCYYNGELYTENENFITKRYAERSFIKLNVIEKLSDVMKDDIQKIIMIDSHKKLESAYKAVTDMLGENIPAEMFFSSDDLFEFSAKGKTKGTALLKLSQILNEPLYRFAAIGDNENDADMLKFAGMGIAVANAVASCKHNADFVTARDCNNSGFAQGAEYVISANRGK